MKIPLSWLQEYFTIPLDPAKIDHDLTMAGIEIDKVEKIVPSFQNVVVGKVVSVSPHPNADRLQIATVFDGQENYQVVCGASNCREGIKTAFARIGAVLLADDKSIEIKKTKIRSIESFGMLCSAQELGVSAKEESGIIECDPSLVEGTDFATFYTDIIFHISLTPNLGHCMSVRGIARELAAIYDTTLRIPQNEVHEDHSLPIEKAIEVTIQDPSGCKRYSCRMMHQVKVGPSPATIRRYVEACGMNSINNVVDIANLVMLETGQPLHIFDYDSLLEKKIIVTSDRKEHCLCLDNVNREILNGNLVISDTKRTLAIAGMIGGLDSAVTEKTTTILIESATFDSKVIRKMMNIFGLRTEAANRFEKGTDIEGTILALERAAYFIQMFAGAKAYKGIIDVLAVSISPKEIRCRISHVNKILGTQLSTNEVVQILKRLDIAVVQELKDLVVVEPPTYRNDLNIEVDIIEEIARIYGYNSIAKKITSHTSSSILNTPMYEMEKRCRSLLLQEGLQECITCNLIGPTLATLTKEKSLGEDHLIHVLHPSSIDQSILRTSLLPSLLQVVKTNQDQQFQNISCFEIGKIHFKQDNQFIEQTVAGILLTGVKAPYHYHPKTGTVDFFDLKGMIENVMNGFGIKDFVFEPSHLENFHPFRQAKIRVNDEFIGVIGEVHPEHQYKLDLKQKLYFAELHLQPLLPFLNQTLTYQAIQIYPSSERDWTFTAKKNVTMTSIFQMIHENSPAHLESVSLVDIYTSKDLGDDKKNITLRFVYRDKEKTISSETVEKEHNELLSVAGEKISLLYKIANVT